MGLASHRPVPWNQMLASIVGSERQSLIKFYVVPEGLLAMAPWVARTRHFGCVWVTALVVSHSVFCEEVLKVEQGTPATG